MILKNFAVIEGCDGSGTTTQVKLLEDNLNSKENPKTTDLHAAEPKAAYGLTSYFVTYEPTQGPVGLLIRRILKGEITVERETLARLFAADRAEHLYASDGIVKRCKRGEFVVSDRYTPSSLVYQGLECGRELPEILNSDFPHPELLIYLDLDSETAIGRIGKREEQREIYDHLEFQARVRSAYLELLPFFEEAGVRVCKVDGTKEPSELADEIWSEVGKMSIMKK
ncbi:MAG: dTMP kinase [Treponema sp.]|nr:dTMP kinase [Treponema sp.]